MTKRWLAVAPVVLALAACSNAGEGPTTFSGTVQPAGVTDHGTAKASSPVTPSPSATSSPKTTSSPDDFGFITQATESAGAVTITFDRATFVKDDQATDGYRITDTNTRLRTFAVRSDAALKMLVNPGGGPQLVKVTPSQLVAKVKNRKAPVWLRHTDGLDGPVTAVTEQYLP